VIRQLLVESLLLAAIGAAFGGLLAGFLSGGLVSFLDTSEQSISLEIGADWRVLAFTAGAAVLTCILFGLAPAVRATRVSVNAVMRSSGRGLTAGRERFALRRALVTLQVALSLLLLVGALLFTRTLANLLDVDPGFRTDGVVVTNVDLRPLRTPREQQRAQLFDVLQRLRSVPGVRSAAVVNVVPMSGSSWGNDVWMEGDRQRRANSLFNRVTPDYFATLGIPVIAGRDFTGADTPDSPAVAIVNETFVRQVARGEQVLGRQFRVEATSTRPEAVYEIVGVVKDAKYLDLRQTPYPVAFFAATQMRETGPRAQFVVRSDLPPASFTSAIAAAMRALNPAVVVSFTVLETQIRETLVRERLMATLSGFFGGVAALLAVVGLYGVIAYTVARRTNEIGIRMALGAGRPDVLRMILREAAMLIGAGLVVGVGLALLSGRAARTLLFGLEPWDPATIVMASALLAGIALVASYLPARAAARIEPMRALRVE
jgi:predicted permease